MQDFKYTIKDQITYLFIKPYPIPIPSPPSRFTVSCHLLLWKLVVARRSSLIFRVFVLLILIPSTAKDILESVLESTTVHVNQSLLLFGVWVTKDRNETQISRRRQHSPKLTLNGGSGLNILVHLHEMDHGLVVQDNMAFCLLDLITPGLAVRMIPRIQLGYVHDHVNII